MTYNPLIKNVYFIQTPQIKSRKVTLPSPTRGLHPQLQSYSPSCYVSVLSMAHPIKPRHKDVVNDVTSTRQSVIIRLIIRVS